MNKSLLLLVFICSTLLFSCNKESQHKERLNGKWIYEKATWQEKTFKRKDILEDYLFFDVYFTDDCDIQMINERDKIFLIGTYELDHETETGADFEGNPMVTGGYKMKVMYQDTISKQHYQEEWDIVRIGKNIFRYETELNGKKAYFKLRRQLL